MTKHQLTLHVHYYNSETVVKYTILTSIVTNMNYIPKHENVYEKVYQEIYIQYYHGIRLFCCPMHFGDKAAALPLATLLPNPNSHALRMP